MYNLNTKMSKKIKALSFFSGAMGLDNGLEKAGIETILACEFDKYCQLTIKKNRPKLPLLGDLSQYSVEDIRKAAGLRFSETPDLIVGGPPCQAFSSAGKRKGFQDDRGNIFLIFLDRLIALRPKYFVIENVRGLMSAEHNGQKGGAMSHIIQRLEKAGYNVTFNLYNSANFGSPQSRERYVIMGTLSKTKLPFLKPTHSQNGIFNLPKWKTLREAIGDLRDANHDHTSFPEKRLKYYRMLKAGQNWRNLSEELQKEALGKSYHLGGGKTGFLRRLDWNKPAPTLVTSPTMPATDLAHPEELRPLSVQEYKRIQEFPDKWIIEGPIIQQYKQIGNAVPCSLGAAIGALIIDHHKEEIEAYERFTNFPYSRYKNTCDSNWRKRNQEKLQLLSV